MSVKNPNPVHPGRVLKMYREDMGLNQTEFAKLIDKRQKDISNLEKGSDNITVDIALRLEKALNTRAEMWLNIQQSWALHQERQNRNQFYTESSEGKAL